MEDNKNSGLQKLTARAAAIVSAALALLGTANASGVKNATPNAHATPDGKDFTWSASKGKTRPLTVLKLNNGSTWQATQVAQHQSHSSHSSHSSHRSHASHRSHVSRHS